MSEAKLIKYTRLPSLGKLDLGILPVRGINDGCAAHLGDPLSVTVKGPATNLVGSDDIFNEQNLWVGRRW